MSDRDVLLAIGRRIREARRAAQLRQDQLARHLLVSVATIGGWEMGRTGPGALNLIRLAAVLGVTVGWLLLGEGTAAS